MALLSIYRGTQAEVSERPVSDGALLFATDTKKIYLDKGSSRVEMSSLQDLSDYVTNEELTEGLATKAPLSHSHTTAQVTGLDSALAGKAPTGHTHAAATDAAAGFMSATDKEKLDGIAEGANKYTLPTASSSTLGGVKTGANITNSSGTISLTKANVTSALGYTPPTTDTNTWTAFKGATTSAAGTAGYVPAPTAGAATRYLRSDGTWAVPPDTNTTYTLSSFGITATAAELNKLDGVTATTAEINYLDGVTSAIQTQLNGKAASSHSHPASQVTGLTASRALISDSSGHPAVSTVSSTELGYLDGVTSSIQTQLNNKASTNHTHSYLPLSGGTLTGTVTSRSLAAATDSTYDIGTSSVRYRNIYADNLYGTLQGSVTSANKLTTARTISLAGDVTGSTSFNGSANVSISAQIAANAVTANEIAAGAVGSSEIAANAVTLTKLGSDVGTVAVQSTQPTDSNVKLWIQT